MVNGVLGFLEHTTSRSSALDHRAAASLQDYIGELRALETFSCTLSESLRFIRERVTSLYVAPERPRPGHLYACRIAQSGYAGRAHLFVVGLEEGRVFPRRQKTRFSWIPNALGFRPASVCLPIGSTKPFMPF
jgi:hypothetical protein